MEQYITEALMLILGALVGWFPNRKKQKVDTKQIEVEVLEKSLQILNKDVVEPLRNNLELLRSEYTELNNRLKKFQDAINKMYNCRNLAGCPIRIELQKSENNNRRGNTDKQRANRPRDSTRGENGESNNHAPDNGDGDTEQGADR